MTKILFIGNPASIHDFKWVKHLKEHENIEAFFSTENGWTDENKTKFTNSSIFIGPNLFYFSLINWRENLVSYFALKHFIKTNKIDIVHIFIGTAQVIIPSFLKTPVVLTTRGTDVNMTLQQLANSSSIKNKILLKFITKAYSSFTQITCTSQTQIDSIKKVLPDIPTPLKVVRTGVNIEELETTNKYELPKALIEKKIVLFVRNIHKNYDPILSVNAVVKLPPEVLKSTHFFFMKGTDYDKKLFKEMQVILTSAKIDHTFIEPMPNSKVWALIKTSDLIVMNPISDGTPNSAIETMAARKNLIMGYCKYDSDLFNESTTVFLSKRDEDELCQKIKTELLTNNPEKLERAYNTVWKLARQNTEMKIIKEIYNEILSK
jgi:hypothetical protein